MSNDDRSSIGGDHEPKSPLFSFPFSSFRMTSDRSMSTDRFSIVSDPQSRMSSSDLPSPTVMPQDRFSSISDLATSAITIDGDYSLKSSGFHIVSSDGTLFCVPEKVMRHSDFFWDLRAESSGGKEICLTDGVLETAKVVKLFLWAMEGRSSDLSVHNCTRGTLIEAARLAERLGGSMVVTNLLFAIGVHLDKGCTSCKIGTVFTLAAQLDNLGLASRAAAKLCEKPRLTGISEEDFDGCPPGYLFKLLKAVWLTIPIEAKDPAAIQRAFCK